MKVLFKKNIKSYSGENDELVYQAFRDGWVCIGRDYGIPTYTATNQELGTIGKNLSRVFKAINADYVTDLKIYAQRNGKENVSRYDLIPGAYALYVKMMFAWQKSDPLHVDLATVTVGDIITLDADVRTVMRAIDAGYLANVSLYSDLTADIQ
jgi:hypothetical protein